MQTYDVDRAHRRSENISLLRTPTLLTANDHAKRAAEFLARGQDDLARLIEKGAGSQSPPHFIPIAQVHATLALALAQLGIPR